MIAALSAPAAVHAQLRATVVDADSRPVAGAYLTVRRAGDRADTAIAATARADAAGAAMVRGLRAGRYTLGVRALGFAPFSRTGVAVTPQGGAVDLGPLMLTRVATQLSGTRVVGERDATTLAPDRNTFNVRDLAAASGGTAVDVLRNVPAVEVDGDNTVTLRGNANVVVQINGRPSPLRGQQLGTYLAQLPANLVARVEVATNPSARNDPDGAAGVINLVLAQRTDLGTSGGLTAATATTGLANLSGNLARQAGPWTGFASYSFFRDDRPQTGTNDRFDASGGVPETLFATLDGHARPLFHTGTLRGERKIGRFDAVFADAVLNGGAFRRTNDASYRAESGGVAMARFVQRSALRVANVNQDYVLGWRRTVGAGTNAQSVELRYNDADNTFTNVLRLQPSPGVDSPIAPAVGASRDRSAQRTPTWRLQADWTRAPAKATKLEAGVVGIRRRGHSAIERTDAALGAPDSDTSFVVDATRTNAFVYREQVAAVYGVLSRRAGPLEVQGGLRLERATTQFDLDAPIAVTVTGATGRRFRNAYASAFPSGLVAYSVSPTRQLKASYSRRISRPNAEQISPVPYREDALNVTQGNPGLRPEFTDAYELGYQHTTRWGSLQLNPYYRRTPDAVRYVRAVDAAGVARGSFANVALSQSYGADLTTTVRTGRLTLFGGGSVFGIRTDARNVTPDVSFRTGGWSARANATLKLSPLVDFQSSATYRAPQTTEAGRQQRFATTTFALRRKLRGDAVTLTLRATDPFNTAAWGVRTATGPVVQTVDRRYGLRALGVSVNATFGRAPRLRPPRLDDGGPPAGGAPGAAGGGPPG